jgi:CRP-like cAMP-binding protein
VRRYNVRDTAQALLRCAVQTRLTQCGTARQKQRKKPAPTEFVKVPMLWVQCLVEKRVGVNAYRVAHYVLHEAWRTNDPKVKLTNAALAANGVDRKGKSTALRQLRKAGLISVAERPKRSPVVTVRFLEQ